MMLKEAVPEQDVSDHMQTRRSVLVCMSLHTLCLSGYRTKPNPNAFNSSFTPLIILLTLVIKHKTI